MKLHRYVLSASLLATLALYGCGERDAASADTSGARDTQSAMPEPLADWPHVDSAIKSNPALEARVREIVAGMTLAQKVGQMTQAEIKSITPAEVREYYIGSVLNGGGSWPGQDKHASVADWVAVADGFHDASMAVDAKVPVPIMWGTDAMHGHSNVYRATIFPHNIGLGAAHDAELVGRIATTTGRAVRATGIDWLFAPAVPVVLDTRWGRSYESWSQDPALVREYAASYTQALQGGFADDANAIASVKHFIGDGGTEHGQDQGVTRATLGELINIHGAGYYGALGAGAQTVMASYNSWVDTDSGEDHGKMHGAKILLTGALKEKMGFDGFVVSDYNGIGQLPGCSNSSCADAINAGIDMVMVPDDWKAFIANTIEQVEAGDIPMARIDDAVSRILRVKLRAGLFDGRKPSQHTGAGTVEAIQDRALAREAVRKTLVLLKNEDSALPLSRDARVLVVGKSADSIPNQAGGWSLTWQGTDNTNADFPDADSILDGLNEALGEANVTFSETAKGIDVAGFDAVVAVIGETPYAETNGDIVASDTVTHSRRHPEDLAVLQAVAGKGAPVVTVFLSGRPLYTNDLINLSDAFVAAWLPGTEGKGVSDVLVAGADGRPAYDFGATLSFAWPAVACPGPRALGPDGAAPQFALGYGLSYAKGGTVATLPLDEATQCGEATSLPIFNNADVPPYTLTMGAGAQEQVVGADLNSTIEWPRDAPALRVRTVQVNTQQDAKEVTWLAPARLLSRSAARNNFNAFALNNGALQFDVALVHAPADPVMLSMTCGPDCGGAIDLAPVFAGLEPGEKHTVKVPLACFAGRGANLGATDVPFAIEADAPFAASFTRIRVVAGAGDDEDALDCGEDVAG
ncbi:glycoside hydrolase family 3 N-terminal domain-containing protein [Lysobacter sp. F6437]|uniref:glycoside hydrolase family 3 N-terminal domain-containing protein n=1 Tax=Lysobacter sp. F6437 TaxID=3459296 RepID=UPI00403D887B